LFQKEVSDNVFLQDQTIPKLGINIRIW